MARLEPKLVSPDGNNGSVSGDRVGPRVTFLKPFSKMVVQYNSRLYICAGCARRFLRLFEILYAHCELVAVCVRYMGMTPILVFHIYQRCIRLKRYRTFIYSRR